MGKGVHSYVEMSIRRSQRAGGAHVSGGVTSALESMRRMKREGKRRLDDYEVNEAAPVYDEVDEEEYAQITAQKRKETREFLVGKDVEETRKGFFGEERGKRV